MCKYYSCHLKTGVKIIVSPILTLQTIHAVHEGHLSPTENTEVKNYSACIFPYYALHECAPEVYANLQISTLSQ